MNNLLGVTVFLYEAAAVAFEALDLPFRTRIRTGLRAGSEGECPFPTKF